MHIRGTEATHRRDSRSCLMTGVAGGPPVRWLLMFHIRLESKKKLLGRNRESFSVTATPTNTPDVFNIWECGMNHRRCVCVTSIRAESSSPLSHHRPATPFAPFSCNEGPHAPWRSRGGRTPAHGRPSAYSDLATARHGAVLRHRR